MSYRLRLSEGGSYLVSTLKPALAPFFGGIWVFMLSTSIGYGLAEPDQGTWRTVASMPTKRTGIAAAALDGRVYVFGGEGATGTFSENEVYDPAHDTCQRLAPMPTARHGLGSAVVQGRIYVIGGGPTPGGSFSDLNEVFTPPSGNYPETDYCNAEIAYCIGFRAAQPKGQANDFLFSHVLKLPCLLPRGVTPFLA